MAPVKTVHICTDSFQILVKHIYNQNIRIDKIEPYERLKGGLHGSPGLDFLTDIIEV